MHLLSHSRNNKLFSKFESSNTESFPETSWVVFVSFINAPDKTMSFKSSKSSVDLSRRHISEFLLQHTVSETADAMFSTQESEYEFTVFSIEQVNKINTAFNIAYQRHNS